MCAKFRGIVVTGKSDSSFWGFCKIFGHGARNVSLVGVYYGVLRQTTKILSSVGVSLFTCLWCQRTNTFQRSVSVHLQYIQHCTPKSCFRHRFVGSVDGFGAEAFSARKIVQRMRTKHLTASKRSRFADHCRSFVQLNRWCDSG